MQERAPERRQEAWEPENESQLEDQRGTSCNRPAEEANETDHDGKVYEKLRNLLVSQEDTSEDELFADSTVSAADAGAGDGAGHVACSIEPGRRVGAPWPPLGLLRSSTSQETAEQVISQHVTRRTPPQMLAEDAAQQVISQLVTRRTAPQMQAEADVMARQLLSKAEAALAAGRMAATESPRVRPAFGAGQQPIFKVASPSTGSLKTGSSSSSTATLQVESMVDFTELVNGLHTRKFEVRAPKTKAGVQYRRSKALHDTIPYFARNGSTVEGKVENNGDWLRASENMYLPIKLGGTPLLDPVPGGSEDAFERVARDGFWGLWCSPCSREMDSEVCMPVAVEKIDHAPPWVEPRVFSAAAVPESVARGPCDEFRDLQSTPIGDERSNMARLPFLIKMRL
eukprot:TRINITY_DN7610_c0_g1_i1.p1 TRINITY_DN7610_c0_g1~~TRINITY_DN7610_c0_g1_i1.p1  ORF type:complete len:399 (-),score=68.03 TRINITY_DN7610_c0_g1_i1:59-1255(-)